MEFSGIMMEVLNMQLNVVSQNVRCEKGLLINCMLGKVRR